MTMQERLDAEANKDVLATSEDLSSFLDSAVNTSYATHSTNGDSIIFFVVIIILIVFIIIYRSSKIYSSDKSKHRKNKNYWYPNDDIDTHKQYKDKPQ